MDICGDNRFEIIERAKKHLLDATNIDTSPKEMEVLDDFLFRCWQMGWLDRYDTADTPQTDRPCNKCDWYKKYGRCIFGYCHYAYEQAHKDTPQTDCVGCEDSMEVWAETRPCVFERISVCGLDDCEQTDCPWK